MASQELLDYIKQENNLGVQKETIYSDLSTQGWPEHLIDEGFAVVNSSASAEQNPSKIV